jgi:Nse1 non-SMC component of SMC5-6 complex
MVQVNTVDGEIAQLATEYTPTEIQFFKQLVSNGASYIAPDP